jgi:hypothetical protein
MDRLTKFCECIRENDLVTREQSLCRQRANTGLGDFLIKPLPFDFASSVMSSNTVPVYNSQLLHTVNDSSNILFSLMKGSLREVAQNRRIVATAAPSGTGKTHLAHSLGRKCFVSVIRVAVSDNTINGKMLALPWVKLMHAIELMQQSVRNEPFHLARAAYLLIELLLAVYYQVTVEVIKLGVSWNLEIVDVRELLLRFFRNRTSDAIVADVFEEKLRGLFPSKTPSETQLNEFSKEIDDYILTSKTKFNNINFEESFRYLVFCFDEVQLLLDQKPGLFIQQSLYQTWKADGTAEIAESDRRPFFYGFSSQLQQFLCVHQIGIFLTGTNFSIANLERKGNVLSVYRGKTELFKIDTYLGIKEMITLFGFYYNFPASFFNSEDIKGCLTPFIGRPRFFVEFLLACIPECHDQFLKNGEIDKIAFIQFCVLKKQSLESYIEGDMRTFFNSYKPIPNADHLTVKSLLPRLVRDVLCGTGKLYLTKDAVVEAISERVIPIAGSKKPFQTADRSIAENSEKIEVVDLAEVEPTTFIQIRSYLKTQVKSEKNYILGLIYEALKDEKGKLAELMFCYYVSLTVLETDEKPRLYDLLSPLFPYRSTSQLEYIRDLRGWMCSASCVIDVAKYKKNYSEEITCELELFDAIIEREKGISLSSSSSLIFYNFDEHMGIDIAFVCADNAGSKRLTTFQSKNWGEGGLKAALETLSPGLQYLNKTQRTQAFRGERFEKISGTPGNGHQSVKWKNYFNWIEANKANQDRSFYCKDWIRIALIATIPTESDYSFIHSQLKKDFKTKIQNISFRVRDRRSYYHHCLKLETNMTTSPLFVLSYNSLHWLDRS